MSWSALFIGRSTPGGNLRVWVSGGDFEFDCQRLLAELERNVHHGPVCPMHRVNRCAGVHLREQLIDQDLCLHALVRGMDLLARNGQRRESMKTHLAQNQNLSRQ